MKKYIVVACAIGIAGFSSCKKKTEPTACISADKTDVLVGEVIQFTNCSENYLNSEWNFGDGSNTNVTDPSHRFGEAGEQTVHLKVVDVEGLSETTTSTIKVNNLRLSRVDMVDGEIGQTGKQFIVSVNGSELASQPGVKETSFSGTASYEWENPGIVPDGEMTIVVEKQEEVDAGWFTYWETVDSYSWTARPFDDLGDEEELIFESTLEGLTVTLVFEKTLE